MIRNAEKKDFKIITDIYNHYIENTIITFEETPLSVDEMLRRLDAVLERGYPWLVYEEDGDVFGYAYCGAFKARCSYRFSAETSIYLDPEKTGRGVGSKLYAELIDKMKSTDVHALIAGIALPNPGSEALQKSFGFEKIAHFKEVGFKFNSWIDVAYWEMLVKGY